MAFHFVISDSKIRLCNSRYYNDLAYSLQAQWSTFMLCILDACNQTVLSVTCWPWGHKLALAIFWHQPQSLGPWNFEKNFFQVFSLKLANGKFVHVPRRCVQCVKSNHPCYILDSLATSLLSTPLHAFRCTVHSGIATGATEGTYPHPFQDQIVKMAQFQRFYGVGIRGNPESISQYTCVILTNSKLVKLLCVYVPIFTINMHKIGLQKWWASV